MTADSTLYDNPRIAAGYAFARPAVHPIILSHLREVGQLETAARALDIGCGAGRSTAALDGLAAQVVGIDPASRMMEHRRVVAPRAAFVVGAAEKLPFQDGVFDLITAAGSINYTNRSEAIPEIARVLGDAGTLVIYDFSMGRRLADGRPLETWYAEFERRYPTVRGYEMEVKHLPLQDAGLGLAGYEEFEVSVPMTLDSYLRYVLSETRVELARLAGTPEARIREWCRLSLEEILDDDAADVVFEAYAACIRREKGRQPPIEDSTVNW